MIFFEQVIAILWKDIRYELRSKQMWAGMGLFALLVLVIFNFAFDLRVDNRAAVAPGALWVSFVFASMLGLGRTIAAEREKGSMDRLLLCPVDRKAIYLAKLLGNMLFIGVVEIVALPIFAALFNVPLLLGPLLPIVLLGTLGIAAVGTLFSAMAAATRARELLLPILVFPLIVPIVIAAVRATGTLMVPVSNDLLRRSQHAQWRLASVESELATARRIQESILPRRGPSIADVASVYVPASSVAGDYFDFIDAGEQSFGVVVADVSGHGVGAALVASMLKVAIAMKAAHVREPARLLAELNAFFCGKLERQFITAVAAFIDVANGRVVAASAGHPPPLVRRANGAVEELATSGFVLGRMRAAEYHDAALTLAKGDAIVFYTDGVIEAEGWSSARLEQCVARGGTAREIADGIVAALPKANEDDVTMVVVRL